MTREQETIYPARSLRLVPKPSYNAHSLFAAAALVLTGWGASACHPVNAAARAKKSAPPSTVAASRQAAVSSQPHLPSAKILYARHLIADQMFSYRGHQVTTYWGTGRSASVEVYHRAPQFHRIEYQAPDTKRGLIIVTNGTGEWQYSPIGKQLTYRKAQPDLNGFEDANLDYDLLQQNYSVQVSDKPREWAERKAAVVSITRKAEHTLARRLWFDLATGLLLKSEHYNEAGKLRVIVSYTEINFHAPVPRDLFDFNKLAKQPGVRVVQAPPSTAKPVPLAALKSQLDGLTIAPRLVTGYHLVAAALAPSTQGTVLQLKYSDGLNTVSLFEKKRVHLKHPTRVLNGTPIKIGRKNGNLTRSSSLSTLNWDAGSVNLTAIGEIPLRSLTSFADAADNSIR